MPIRRRQPAHVYGVSIVSSDPSDSLGVNSIPATYLMGKDGKIIGKNLRGDALESAVKTALATN